MENSTTGNARDDKNDELKARVLVKLIKREERLRHIVEQSAFGFFFGETTLSRILRIIGFVLLLGGITFYVLSDAFTRAGVWPLISIAAFVEALRANRRLDAKLELELIAEQIHPARADNFKS